MKLNDLLKYLNEVAAPEAPKDAPLGQYLFAPNRKGVPREKNTPLETKIFNSLASHYDGNVDPGEEKTLATLADLNNKGMYQKLLKPPAGLVYRFISNVNPKEASKLFLNNLPVKDIISVPNKAFYVSPIGIVNRPGSSTSMNKKNSNISSWTMTPKMPEFEEFAGMKNFKTLSILLVARTEGNNFFINPKEMSKLTDNPDNVGHDEDYDDGLYSLDVGLVKKEQEVIGYGPINVLEASYIYFGKAVDEPEAYDLENNIPELDNKYRSQKLIPGEAFQPLITYVDAAIAKYADNFSKKQLAELQRLKRPILKLAQSKSKVPGEVYLDAHENAQTVIEELLTYLDDTFDFLVGIQAELLKALSIKMKKPRPYY